VASEDFVRVVHGDDSVEIVARLERRRAEALALKLRALARRYGLEVQSVRILPGEIPAVEPTNARAPSVE
jgi:hypothetical protein